MSARAYLVAVTMAMLTAGCVRTRPLTAYRAADGMAVGVSVQRAWMRPLDIGRAYSAACDTAGIRCAIRVESAVVRGRLQLTVHGHE